MIQHVCGVCNLVRWRFRMASHTDLISFVQRIVGFVILSQCYTVLCTKTQLTSFEPEPKTARPHCKPMNHTRASHTLSAGALAKQQGNCVCLRTFDCIPRARLGFCNLHLIIHEFMRFACAGGGRTAGLRAERG